MIVIERAGKQKNNPKVIKWLWKFIFKLETSTAARAARHRIMSHCNHVTSSTSIILYLPPIRHTIRPSSLYPAWLTPRCFLFPHPFSEFSLPPLFPCPYLCLCIITRSPREIETSPFPFFSLKFTTVSPHPPLPLLTFAFPSFQFTRTSLFSRPLFATLSRC